MVDLLPVGMPVGGEFPVNERGNSHQTAMPEDNIFLKLIFLKLGLYIFV